MNVKSPIHVNCALRFQQTKYYINITNIKFTSKKTTLLQNARNVHKYSIPNSNLEVIEVIITQEKELANFVLSNLIIQELIMITYNIVNQIQTINKIIIAKNVIKPLFISNSLKIINLINTSNVLANIAKKLSKIIILLEITIKNVK